VLASPHEECVRGGGRPVRAMGSKSSEGVLVSRLNSFVPAKVPFCALLLFGVASILSSPGLAQEGPRQNSGQALRTTEDWNKRLRDLLHQSDSIRLAPAQEYRIGPEDLVEITVFEAPELSRSARVSAGGEISLPLLGGLQAAGLTPRELELVLQELLRRAYMKDPHVGVFVREMQSHPVSVFGAVEKPGVFQIRGTKTLIEMLSMAEGLAEASVTAKLGVTRKELAEALAWKPREVYLGEGDIDFRGITAGLRDAGYAGWWNFEGHSTVDPEKDAAMGFRYLTALLTELSIP